MDRCIDIRAGDLFVVGGVEYPVKSAAYYTMKSVSALGFARMAQVSAYTKRNPVVDDGKIEEAQVLIANIYCTPMDPVDAEVRKRSGLDTPHELLQTFVADNAGFIHIILEDLKR